MRQLVTFGTLQASTRKTLRTIKTLRTNPTCSTVLFPTSTASHRFHFPQTTLDPHHHQHLILKNLQVRCFLGSLSVLARSGHSERFWLYLHTLTDIAFSNMIMAWYYAGYYTGQYQVCFGCLVETVLTVLLQTWMAMNNEKSSTSSSSSGSSGASES